MSRAHISLCILVALVAVAVAEFSGLPVQAKALEVCRSVAGVL